MFIISMFVICSSTIIIIIIIIINVYLTPLYTLYGQLNYKLGSTYIDNRIHQCTRLLYNSAVSVMNSPVSDQCSHAIQIGKVNNYTFVFEHDCSYSQCCWHLGYDISPGVFHIQVNLHWLRVGPCRTVPAAPLSVLITYLEENNSVDRLINIHSYIVRDVMTL